MYPSSHSTLSHLYLYITCLLQIFLKLLLSPVRHYHEYVICLLVVMFDVLIGIVGVIFVVDFGLQASKGPCGIIAP